MAQAAEIGQHGMFQRGGGEIDVALRPPRLPQQLARQQPLRGGEVERRRGVGVAAQEDRHAVAFGGIIGQFLPDRRFQRRGIDQAHGRKAVQRLARQLIQADDLAIEAGPPLLHRNRRGQRHGEEQRPLGGGLGGGDQDPPGGLHFDGEVAGVVGRQAVLPDDPQQALVRADAQPLDMKARLLRLLRGAARTFSVPAWRRPATARRCAGRRGRCRTARCRCPANRGWTAPGGRGALRPGRNPPGP